MSKPNPAKIAVFGASGMIGQRIMREALDRGHHLTALVRDPTRIKTQHPHLAVHDADLLDAGSTAGVAQTHDVVISAYAPPPSHPEHLVDAAHVLLEAMLNNPGRLIVVGGAGLLEVSPGVSLLDTPDFLPEWKPVAIAHRDALKIYRDSDVNWTFVSPAALTEPGKRSGKYRVTTGKVLVDQNGVSRITAEDYAVAIIDEVETPHYKRTNFGVAY